MPDQVAHRTLAELHRLPDDGNRYEIVRGALFVTPPPSWEHQRLASLIAARLQPTWPHTGWAASAFRGA